MDSEKTTMVSISSEKLKKQVTEKYKNVSEIQRELGCGNAIHNAIMRGHMPKPLYILLHNMGFEISPEEPQNDDISEYRSWLKQIITEAVIDALRADDEPVRPVK